MPEGTRCTAGVTPVRIGHWWGWGGYDSRCKADGVRVVERSWGTGFLCAKHWRELDQLEKSGVF